MTTPAKIAANRRNARLSTGPRTLAGKLAVARNAISHGIFASLPVVPGENLDDWHAHRTGIVESLAPAGLLEVSLAERAALLLWRLGRLAKYEAEAITAGVEDAGLLPDGADPVPYFGSQSHNRENQLVMAEQSLRRAREDLAAVAPEAHLLRRIRFDDGIDALPPEPVKSILFAAYNLVLESPLRRFTPHPATSDAFLSQLGMPESTFKDVRWTRDRFLVAIGYYADAVGSTAADFRAELQENLDSRATRLVRTVEQLEADVAALTRRLNEVRDRSASMARLAPDQIADRVMKYERHLHSLLASTLHELERLQARRAGTTVAPPLVADVHVQVSGVDGEG